MIIKLPEDLDDYSFEFHSVQQARGHVSIAPEPEREDGASEAEERHDEAYVYRLMRAIQSKSRTGPPDHRADEDEWARFQACDHKRVESWIEENGSREFERRAWLILGLIRNVHTQGAPAKMMKQYLDDIMHSMYLIVGFDERIDRIVNEISAHPSIAWDFLSHHEDAKVSEATRHIALMLHSWVPKVNERWTEFRKCSILSFDDDSPLQKSEATKADLSGPEAVETAGKVSGDVKTENDDRTDLESTPSEARPPFKPAALRQTPKVNHLSSAGSMDMARLASQKRQAQAAATSRKAKAKFSEPQSRGFSTSAPIKRKRVKGAVPSDAEKGDALRQSGTLQQSIKKTSAPRKASEKDPALAATLEQMIKDNIGNFPGHKTSHRRGKTGFFGAGG